MKNKEDFRCSTWKIVGCSGHVITGRNNAITWPEDEMLGAHCDNIIVGSLENREMGYP